MNHRTRLPRGSTLQLGFLAATIILAIWLGYQAFDADRSHERAVQAALNDYAGISAWQLARVVQSDVDEVLGDVFRVVRRRMWGGLPPAEVVGWNLHRAVREEGCVACRGFREPLLLFRIRTDGDPRNVTPEGVDTTPDTASAATRRTLANLVLSQPMERRNDGIFTVRGGTLLTADVAVGFYLSRDEDDVVEAAYGFVVPASALGELVAEIYDHEPLLPRPIARGQPNDSLLSVRVRDASGLVIWRNGADDPETWAASEGFGPDFGTLVAEATVRPEAAPQLIIGGLPKSRLPLLAVMLLLTMGLGAAAFVQQRRELSFQRLRDDFVSGVSHELRTPLAQIQMFSELQSEGKLTNREDRERAVKVIQRESRRLSHLVDNILQFTRLRRTSGLGWPKERLDLAEACADGIDAVVPLLEDRGMTLDLEATTGLTVEGNRDAISRIVVNLLDNAVKYGKRGQTVRVRIEPGTDGTARLAVSDEGPGVPEADRARLWKPYRRLARDVEASTPGTGIGLSIVAQLVDLHEGRVHVEDADGGGACFVVDLPLTNGHGLAGAVDGGAPSGGTTP
jgi:signal transduction histidine kinase